MDYFFNIVDFVINLDLNFQFFMDVIDIICLELGIFYEKFL